jgi:7-cyano-7-deazaguanine synthase
MDNFKSSALVLFSGGQDSATCLALALDKYSRVETIGFSYGQRHSIELECRKQFISKLRHSYSDWSKKLGDDHMMDLSVLGQISDTALTQEKAIQMQSSGLPNTFVPGRNLIFLTFAATVAYRRNLKVIVAGMCETDYSGYPDCRDDTIKALQVAINLGLDTRLVLETPLMWIDKAATWQIAQNIGGQDLLDLVREDTHTCYLGDRSRRHEWGYGCGSCPACDLRRIGFENFTKSQKQ